jgi:hypothetical protein
VGSVLTATFRLCHQKVNISLEQVPDKRFFPVVIEQALQENMSSAAHQNTIYSTKKSGYSLLHHSR